MAPSGDRPDDSEDVFTFSYPPEADDQPSMAIVEAVSWVKGVPVTELDPLHRTVRTDTLNRFFGESTRTGALYRSSERSSPSERTMTFGYEGLRVTVAPGEIRVERA